MRHLLGLFVGICLVLSLSACLGEDYDVGVPTAYLQVKIGLQEQQTQLKEANISWNSSSGNVQQTIDNIQEFGLSQDEIKVSPNQEASLEFKENEDNGGDIWTDPKITATLWKDDKQIGIELNDQREFNFPTNEGNYVLEVKFINQEKSAQYLGNIVIEKPSTETKKVDGKLPDFSIMEVPSIKKVNAAGTDGVVFDNSYEEVCWNNCDDNNTNNYTDIHSGNVEIGDEILIDWHKMNPQPTEINLIHLNTENNEDKVIKKESINITETTLKIKVDKEITNSQYALEFLWKVKNEIKGKSVLNFKFD